MGCGEDTTGEAESGVVVKASFSDLPRCRRNRPANHGAVYYVEDSGKFFYCDGDKGKYRRLDLVGQDGSACTVTQDTGSATIICDDGSTATVSDGQDGIYEPLERTAKTERRVLTVCPELMVRLVRMAWTEHLEPTVKMARTERPGPTVKMARTERPGPTVKTERLGPTVRTGMTVCRALWFGTTTWEE